MAKGRYAPWIEEDGLTRIEGWAREGLTDEQIAKNMGISKSTFYDWQKKYPDISEALKRGKAPVDTEVESALLKSALGFTETVEKPVKMRRKTRYPDGRIVEEEYIEMVKEEVYIPPSQTAQIYWLKNRRSDAWRDKPLPEELQQTIDVTYSPGAEALMG